MLLLNERDKKLLFDVCRNGKSDGMIRMLSVSTEDFESAVKGYVPASLRGVKLQKSTVDWNDIGGSSQNELI